MPYDHIRAIRLFLPPVHTFFEHLMLKIREPNGLGNYQIILTLDETVAHEF